MNAKKFKTKVTHSALREYHLVCILSLDPRHLLKKTCKPWYLVGNWIGRRSLSSASGDNQFCTRVAWRPPLAAG